MGIFVQIVGITFVCVIMMCIGWSIVEYVSTKLENPRKGNKKLQ